MAHPSSPSQDIVSIKLWAELKTNGGVRIEDTLKAFLPEITNALANGRLFATTNTEWDICLNMGRTSAHLLAEEARLSVAVSWFSLARDAARHLKTSEDLLSQFAGLETDVAILASLKKNPNLLESSEAQNWLLAASSPDLASVAMNALRKKSANLVALEQTRGTGWLQKRRVRKSASLLDRTVQLLQNQNDSKNVSELHEIRERLEAAVDHIPQAASGAKWIELYEEMRSLDDGKQAFVAKRSAEKHPVQAPAVK